MGICQSMLANPTSTAQADVERRDRVRQRNIDFNTALSEVCAMYVRCRFDNNTGFNTEFVPSDVSTLDYFHPSITGQTKMASVTWGATYNFLDSVGGIAEYPDVAQGSADSPYAPSDGSSVGTYALLAGLGALALAALTAGAWYARRRWLG